MTAPTPPVSGATLGIAYFALRKNLIDVLDTYGLTFEQSVMLNYLGTAPRPRHDLLATTADNLKVSTAEIAEHLDKAIADGLVADGLALTEHGSQVRQEVAERTAPLTRTFFADIPAADLAATSRVLATLTERANAALSG